MLRAAFSNADEAYQRFPVEGDLRFQDDRLIAGGQSFQIDDRALTKLCETVGAPPAYIHKLPPGNRAELIQYHLRHGDYLQPGQTAESAAIIAHEGKFVSICRSDLVQLRAAEVVDAISEGIGTAADNVELHHLQTDDHCFECDVVSPAVADEVSSGDTLRGGLRIAYSPIDSFATRIEAYVLRLVCSNGMVRRECVGRTSISRTRRLSASRPHARSLEYEQVRKLAAQTWQGLAGNLSAIKSLRQERAHVPELLARFLHQARMHSQATLRLLEAAWESEGREETAYAAMNALTSVATHRTELSGLQRRSLAALAGVLAHRSTHICPQCFSVISRS